MISNNKCTTLADTNNKFIEIYPNRPQVISAINRFILTEFGLNIKGNRLTKAEKNEACRLAETLLLDELSKEQLEEAFLNSFEKQKVPKKSQKAPKSHINF